MTGAASRKPKKRALGRGLSALISNKEVPIKPAAGRGRGQTSSNVSPTGRRAESGEEIAFVDITSITNNSSQPRQSFDKEGLNELADSIKALGVLQPVLVRPIEDDKHSFEIVAGERRWRAAQIAKLQQLPVIVREFDDASSLEVALVENIQRSNLNPVELARGYQALIEDFSLSQQQIADKVGKDRASVANYLRLLKLPQEVLSLIEKEKLSMGHAKAILTVKEPSVQKSLAKKCIAENLSVRALESIVSRVVVLDRNRKQKKSDLRRSSKSSFPEVTDRLRNSLGTKVIIRHQKSGRGLIEIQYFSEQELDRLVELLAG